MKTTKFRKKVLRLFGEKVDHKVIYQRRVGAYGIILHNNELLLTEQITSENKIEVQLPGGGSNNGESLLRTLYREVLEETGWGIKVLKKDGMFQRFTYMPEYKVWAHKICHVYKCVATIKKTTFIEKNHRLVFMNKKRAAEALYDKGFKYFVQSL